jgi:rod shape determining protein RodA
MKTMINDSSDLLKRYDFSFFIGMGAIFLLGILNLYSATHANPSLMNIYKTQLIYFGLATVIGVAVSFVSPRTIFRYTYFIYGFNIFLLILVLLLGKIGMGAQRWLVIGPVRLQPSELMKISAVLAFAHYFSKVNPDRGLRLKDLIVPAIIAFVPAILVIVQPDLGTGLLIILIFAVIVFYRKLHWKSIGIICLLGMIGGGLMYKYGLKEYQRKKDPLLLTLRRCERFRI